MASLGSPSHWQKWFPWNRKNMEQIFSIVTFFFRYLHNSMLKAIYLMCNRSENALKAYQPIITATDKYVKYALLYFYPWNMSLCLFDWPSMEQQYNMGVSRFFFIELKMTILQRIPPITSAYVFVTDVFVPCSPLFGCYLTQRRPKCDRSV